MIRKIPSATFQYFYSGLYRTHAAVIISGASKSQRKQKKRLRTIANTQLRELDSKPSAKYILSESKRFFSFTEKSMRQSIHYILS